MKYLTFSIILLVFCSCNSSRLLCGYQFTPISPYTLLGNAQHYDGKQVYVVGVVNFSFEDYALYSDEFSFNRKINANSFYINFDVTDSKGIDYMDVKNLHGKIAVIGGIYKYCQVGHLALNTGGMITINYVEAWE